MTDIKIKRYADKENLKELMRYCKATFASKDGSIPGGTPSGDYYTKSEIDTKLSSKANTSDLSNYYTKSEVDNLLSNISGGTGGVSATNAELDELTTEWSFE